MKPIRVLPSDVSSALRLAKGLISLPDSRCKYSAAEDRHGMYCGTSSPDAVSWCPIGAVNWAVGSNFEARASAINVLNLVAQTHGYGSIQLANYEVSHPVLMQMMDEAAGLAEINS